MNHSNNAINARTAILACAAGAAIALPALAQNEADDYTIIHWFENRWSDIEHKTADAFLAYYDAIWLPPITKGASTNTVGYDTFDRFDLGRPGSPTTYGTETSFGAMVAELQASDIEVFVDTILNHNSGRTENQTFHEQGGWPGFWTDPPAGRDLEPTDSWGDFHNGVASGYLQSENPGGPRYDLYEGDLVALVDIAQESNNQFIRHPVDPGNPDNIPAGTIRNQPDPANARFYQDQDLTPFTFSNPGTFRNPGSQQWTIYPFNTADPMQGDPVTENATGLLIRWCQWMLDEHNVDGFRLDAAKHTPSWFWDSFFDSAVYLRRQAPNGDMVTPFSFVEAVDGNAFVFDQFVRKPNNAFRAGDAFGNRDALDLNGAGALRDNLNAAGLGSWSNVIGAHIDNQDAFNDGTVGVNHMFSHDNGSVGNGGSIPPLPTYRQQGYTQHAYLLTRPGPAIVYHNARGIPRVSGFSPREGSPLALGLDPAVNELDDTMTTLTRIRREYARGQFIPLNHTDPNNTSMADVLIYERSSPITGGRLANVLVAVNDRYDAGTQTRTVQTSFPDGTRLHELTGNAANPDVDPSNTIDEVLTVAPGGWVTVTIPNNVSSAGEHNRGYLIYGPAIPTASLQLSNVSGTISADSTQAPPALRRLTDVPVISSDLFLVQVSTTQTDPQDPNTDDNALLRLNKGFIDLNENGFIDIPTGEFAGYEAFTNLHQPLYFFGGTGQYWQQINAATLEEGYHYLSVVVFRHRVGGDPLFRDLRQVIYIDREGPALEVTNADQIIEDTSYTFNIKMLDRTGKRVHGFWDLDESIDPIPLANATNQAAVIDRLDWSWTQNNITHGTHSLTLVAFEDSGNASVTRIEDIEVRNCPADFDNNGTFNTNDFIAFLNAWNAQHPDADIDENGLYNTVDFILFLNLYNTQCQ